jgi:hypothetical protein
MRRFTASVGPLETPVVGQARTSASRAEICGGEPAELGHLGVGATLGGGHQAPAGLAGLGGGVGLAQQLLGQHRGRHLAVGVAGREPG